MRLLFLEEQPRFGGGSERMSLALCQHAILRGHEATLAFATDGDMVPAYASAGASVQQVPARPLAFRQPAKAVRSTLSLRRLATAFRADILFTSQVSYVSLLAAVGKLTGTRTSVHLGLVYDYPSPLFRTGTHGIDLGIAPSEHTAAGWRARNWPPRSLRVIPNGVDLKTFSVADGRDAARRRLGIINLDSPLVAYVGRLSAEKGIFALLRAFADYTRRGGAGHLMFVGNPMNGEDEALRRLGSEEGLRPNSWRIQPATTRPEDVYRSADIVVMPSEWDEPFGLVPLEAMACGTLVIVSDRGVLPSFVSVLGQEAIFRSGDVIALVGRLRYWLDDTARREAAAHLVAADVRQRFAFDRCGDAYLAAFDAIIRR
jgi:glycosyltransferase involved in cell wall biosynthesis